MKRILSIALCILLCGCGNGTSQSPTPAATQTQPFREYANLVADPGSWYDELMALPIANENMTEQELRQLCVDAMRINLTFPWTPTQEIRYTFSDRYTGQGTDVFLPQGIAYSGMFYCNNNARGNVWKALEYYDIETGVLDIGAMGDDFLSVMSSACARSCEWGWSRVSNSTGLQTMESYNQYNSNIVPVGPYTYGVGKYAFTDRQHGTLDIIRDNGEAVMFASYAQMKTADGIYSSSAYHVEMAMGAPVVVYDESGSIDPEKSYLFTQGQGAIGSTGDSGNYLQENGIPMRPLGTVGKKYTFRDLLDAGYIPFTLKEFTGEDPVEAGDAWLGSQTERLENGTPLSLRQVMSKTLFTNYAICVVQLQVKDPQGNVLLSQSDHHDTTPFVFHLSISNREFEQKADALCDGSNTLHIYVRMANGERLEAFQTILNIIH